MKSKIIKKTASIFISFCMVLSTLTIGPFGTIRAMADGTTAPDASTITSAPNSDKITVSNNAEGTNDTIVVTNLSSGDEVKVYNSTTDCAIGTAAASGETATVYVDQLGKDAGIVYVTVTSGEKSESTKVEKSYAAELDTAPIKTALVPVTTAPSIDTITVNNNTEGTSDTIVVTSLSAGDVVKVYNATTDSAIGTAAESSGTATVSIDQLGKSAGSVYVTVTSSGKSESAKIEKSYAAEPDAAPNMTVMTALVPVTTAPAVSTITVDNYIEGIDDKVEVTNLAPDDVVKVYDGTTDSSIGTATESDGTATVNIKQLGKSAGSVFVTVTNSGKSESAKTEVNYSAEPIPWQIYDHTGNKGEDPYPNGDQNINGSEFNKHIILKNNGSRVTFYGYGNPAYKDFIFLPSDENSTKTFTFDMDLSGANYHSMEGGGFLFNSQIVGNTLSGYAILFTGQENSSDRYIKLFKITGVNISTFHDEVDKIMEGYPGISLITSYKQPNGVLKHSVKLEASPTKVNMWDNGTDDSHKIISQSLDTTYGNGIGLIASYRNHNCHILSYFSMTDLDIQGTRYSWPILDLSVQPGNSEATVTFSPLKDAKEVVLQQSTDDKNYTTATTKEPLLPNSTSATVTGLDNGQKYYFRLLVGGGVNEGSSNSASGTPHLMIDNLAAIGADKQVNLTFAAPNGASSVVLEKSTDGQNYATATTKDTISQNSISATVTNLINGQQYYFRLNIQGGSYAGYSNTALATPIAATAPNAPTHVTAAAGNSSASLTWTAPANDGGSPITDYKIDVYEGETKLKTVDTNSAATSAIVPGLTNGTAYTFKVKAVNNVGDSVPSGATTAVTPAAVPDAPTNVAASAGNSSVSLTWTAPSNNGGSAITGYKVDVYAGGSLVKTVNTNSIAPSAIITGLANGTAYTFDVKAVNSAGAGTPSSSTTAVTPQAPYIPSVSHESTSSTQPTPALAPIGPKITANVVDTGSSSKTVSAVKASVAANADGTDTVKFKTSDAVVVKQHNGSSCAFGDYSKIGYEAPQSAPVTVNSDGTVQVKNLAKGTNYDIPVTYDLGGGQKITIGSMHISVDNSGNVSMTSDLIDPYGTLTDSMSGKAITGANVILYYADTARNRASGKTPGTLVQLPGIDGFKPNNNKNPQTTDNDGAYGYMVYPNTDYYITVERDGYDTFTSPIISVATELVKFSARMNPPITGVKRVGGSTRIDTAIELAKSSFTGKVNSIIFATANNYPDALTGSVLAYQQSAPILIVGDSQEDKDKVLTYMKNYLADGGKVFLLGGTGVVTEDFAGQVKNAGYSNVIRLGGIDRYETAAKIKEYLNAEGKTPVIIASGEDYPDALAVSSAAAVNQYPILLVTKNTISDSVKNELSKLKPSKIYFIGGQGAVSEEVKDQITKLTSLDSNNIVRLGGLDRYSTSVSIAKNFKLSGKSACISTGDNFPDALAGSIYAANYNAPIVLVGNALTDEAIIYMQNLKLSGATIFGGEGAVNNEIQNEVTGLISK